MTLLYHACGRAGELKHLMLAGNRGVRWDKKLKSIVITWKETKVIRHYPMPIVPDANSYRTCTVNALAAWAAFGGFGRVDMLRTRAGFLLPSLQTIKSNGIAGYVSKILSGFTSRDLRRASVTAMLLHPDTNQQDVNMRAGHASRNNTDVYYVPTAVSALSGGKALANYTNVRAPVVPAALTEGIIRKLDRYKTAVFPFVTFSAISDDNGRLAPLLEMLLASLFHRWNEMRENGLTVNNCEILNKLVKAVMEVEVINAQGALEKLKEYSTSIDERFREDNAIALGFGNTSGDMEGFMKTQMAATVRLLAEIRSLRSELADVKSHLRVVGNDVQGASFTPTKATSPKEPAKRQMFDVDISMEPERKQAKSEGDTAKNDAYPTVIAILEQLANEGRLSSMGSDSYGFSNEHTKIKKSMAFVGQQITKEQMAVLKSKGDGSDAGAKTLSLKQTCVQIDAQVIAEVVRLNKVAGRTMKSKALSGNWTILSVQTRLKEIKKFKATSEATSTTTSTIASFFGGKK